MVAGTDRTSGRSPGAGPESALALLTPDDMALADRLTIAAGDVDGYGLMRRAGAAVAREVLARFPGAAGFDVLCGPGNNGGDGYVVARLLAEAGAQVRVFADAAPKPGSDAARAAADCPLSALPLSAFEADPRHITIDALYGAGLSRALPEGAIRAAWRCAGAGGKRSVVSIDLPSGVAGGSGHVANLAFDAGLTVTFARRKPGHLLMPGRAFCGEVVVADIGIGDAAVMAAGPRCVENAPALWRDHLIPPPDDTHKYRRGHVAVFSGGPASTGAARLAAMAAARAGAGAVTVLSPAASMSVNAAHLTSIMLAQVDSAGEADIFVRERKAKAAVIGPGFGVGQTLRDLTLALLAAVEQTRVGAGTLEGGVVVDADAITAFAQEPEPLFEAATAFTRRPALVLTPHHGEFSRLFPDIAAQDALSKVDMARRAAERSHAIVVYKGADTVIAAPDGYAAINANGAPWLATAGSGDVLSGLIASLLAQGVAPFEAACAGVWIHAEAGARAGPGVVAEDLPQAVVPVIQELLGWKRLGE